MAEMTDEERDAFLQERRMGVVAIGRKEKGPLMAAIWYRHTDGVIEMYMGDTSLKAKLLRSQGRASLAVIDASRPYRTVTVEGPVTIEALGDDTHDALLFMATRYLGSAAGAAYTDDFMKKLAADDWDGHGTTELRVRITPERWRTEVLGR